MATEYAMEAVVPDEGGPIRLGWDGANWRPLSGDPDGGKAFAGLLDTYMAEEMAGDHHHGNPLVWRAMSGLSMMGGKLTKQPPIPPLPDGAIS